MQEKILLNYQHYHFRRVSDGRYRRTNYRLVVENISSRTSWQVTNVIFYAINSGCLMYVILRQVLLFFSLFTNKFIYSYFYLSHFHFITFLTEKWLLCLYLSLKSSVSLFTCKQKWSLTSPDLIKSRQA